MLYLLVDRKAPRFFGEFFFFFFVRCCVIKLIYLPL